MFRRIELIAAAACVLFLGHVAAGKAEPAAKEAKSPAGKSPATQPVKWTPLFNGKNLDGWKAKGRAVYKVEDGCLVGTQTTGHGGDLSTESQWDNFELRVTYRMVWPANSGFWYRFDAAKSRGYQYDVLKYKRPVAFSGTLYCPGKMFLFRNLTEALENRDDWNEARVWANGDQLIHWLNGHEIGRCRDKTLTKGGIGIQVHGGGFKGMKIIIKKMEIRPLKPTDAPPPPPPAPKKTKKGT
jgi:hypothetical protein